MHLDRLALRVPSQDEEPAYGLFARLAAQNGFADAREFVTRVEHLFSAIVSGRQRESVEIIAGLAPGALEASTLLYTEHKTISGAHVFQIGEWSVKPARICGACLLEDHASAHVSIRPHRRFWWDYNAFDACPRHSTLLQAACTRCQEPYAPLT